MPMLVLFLYFLDGFQDENSQLSTGVGSPCLSATRNSRLLSTAGEAPLFTVASLSLKAGPILWNGREQVTSDGRSRPGGALENGHRSSDAR
ncbi:hypothetical protein BJY01DRAFT_209178 [Aspergillus pseudoustus]|uniref:Secreted protein n=1 Tax=Aspergillus pseudoustus TaxID=1810923 RepID=A0ABR4KII2_9EURO